MTKIKNWYHATTLENAQKIIDCGYLVPQSHKGYTSFGVFLSQSRHQAGMWCKLRGYDEYVVFKVRSLALKPSLLVEGGAHQGDMWGLVKRYLEPVRYDSFDRVQDTRCFDIPGVRIEREGTARLKMVLDDVKAFEEYIDSTPGLRAMIDAEINKA